MGRAKKGRNRSTHGVGGLNEGVVDGNNVDVIVLDRIAEDDTADTAKSVDANLDDHLDWFVLGGGLKLSWGSEMVGS